MTTLTNHLPMQTVEEYPDGEFVAVPKDEQYIRLGMNMYRIERYKLSYRYEMGYGYGTWRAWAITPYGAFCIGEGRSRDYVIKQMNEFIERMA